MYFITACLAHLENTASLNYAGLPNIDLVHYKYFFKKTDLLASLLISSEVPLSIGKLPSLW